MNKFKAGDVITHKLQPDRFHKFEIIKSLNAGGYIVKYINTSYLKQTSINFNDDWILDKERLLKLEFNKDLNELINES